jgi:hypothetical protein
MTSYLFKSSSNAGGFPLATLTLWTRSNNSMRFTLLYKCVLQNIPCYVYLYKPISTKQWSFLSLYNN